MKKSSFFFVHDLNSFSLMGDHMHTFSAGDGYVCRSTCVLPSDDLFASEGLQSNGCSTSSATQSSRLHLFGPVPRFGFCPVDHTRVFARYRDQFACSKAAFLSYGFALQDHLEKHFGKRQSSEALGSFCGSMGLSLTHIGKGQLGKRLVLLLEITQGKNIVALI